MGKAKGKTVPERTRPSGRLARELSLWALLARGSIYQILAILAIMAVGECALFRWSLMQKIGHGWFQFVRFETVFSGNSRYVFRNGYFILFIAAFCLIFIILLRNETENSKSRVSYTLSRLRISRRHLYLVRMLYNFLCFCLLFAVQIWTVLWMCRLYRESMSELVGSQFEFLVFYRIPFLHNLLPLAETAKWVRNLLVALALSAGLAVSLEQRNFTPYWALLVLNAEGYVADVGFQGVDLTIDIVFGIALLVAALKIFGIWNSNADIREPGEE